MSRYSATNRLKRAELTSVVGAGILGAGFGALLSSRLRPYVVAILALGAIAHGWGMWEKHWLERTAGAPRVWWHLVLYWACWLALGALALYIVVAR